MKVSEIKVSYTNTVADKVKISSSANSYEVALAHWDLNVIDYVEQVKVILMNNANVVLGIFELARGGSTSCVVDLKIVLSVALKTHSSAIIMVHNHPSGMMVPSSSDRSISSRLKKACEVIDLKLLDHLIITRDSYYSFADSGTI
jgi:DNA repair protein RadC